MKVAMLLPPRETCRVEKHIGRNHYAGECLSEGAVKFRQPPANGGHWLRPPQAPCSVKGSLKGQQWGSKWYWVSARNTGPPLRKGCCQLASPSSACRDANSVGVSDARKGRQETTLLIACYPFGVDVAGLLRYLGPRHDGSGCCSLGLIESTVKGNFRGQH